jgi:hypothetical protein
LFAKAAVVSFPRIYTLATMQLLYSIQQYEIKVAMLQNAIIDRYGVQPVPANHG